mmetsp:Transcript_51149/g.135471  ORF Transcript_51149/g.135471 Transcript_51149/m.135471 type:complete len:204 (-) Transcript_51149:332-943(-)
MQRRVILGRRRRAELAACLEVRPAPFGQHDLISVDISLDLAPLDRRLRRRRRPAVLAFVRKLVGVWRLEPEARVLSEGGVPFLRVPPALAVTEAVDVQCERPGLRLGTLLPGPLECDFKLAFLLLKIVVGAARLHKLLGATRDLWLVRAVGHRLPTEGLQLGLPPKLLVVRMGLHAGGQLGALRAVRLLLGVLRELLFARGLH